MARLVELEDLKDYAERNLVFSTIDLRLNFCITRGLAKTYCDELVDNGVTKVVGNSTVHCSATHIYKFIK